MKKKVISDIDFADSEYQSFNLSKDRILTVFLSSWNAKPLRIIFQHVVNLVYNSGSDPKNLFEVENSPKLEEITKELYGSSPYQKRFKLFVLEDIDDDSVLQVVAESVTVEC